MQYSSRALEQLMDGGRMRHHRDAVVSGRVLGGCEDEDPRALVVGQFGLLAHGLSWLGLGRVDHDFLSDL